MFPPEHVSDQDGGLPMACLGNMLWRIGETLDIDGQLAWTRLAGFAGVGLHASAGVAGQWRGVEPSQCPCAERERLQRVLAGFRFVEIHAPFAVELRSNALESAVALLGPVLGFAADLGARVVTVHARPPEGPGSRGSADWAVAMEELEAMAVRAGLMVGLEITDGFAAVTAWGLPHVGVTLDVGHMYLPAHRPVLEANGGIGGLVRSLGTTLVHLHLHDVMGAVDHLEAGTGDVAFEAIAEALRDIRYRHNATLELNPDRVSPDGILRSARFVRSRLDRAGRL